MKFAIARTKLFALKRGTRAVFTGLAAMGLVVNLFGCGGGNGGSKSAADSKLLYTESNDPTRNVILAYRRASDGSLTPLASSPIDLRGQGFANPQEQPGPPDADQQIITNANHTLLFAVNSGSNTIAVMKINSDGSLTHISGSPFASGGTNPYTLYLLGNKLYCGNKNVGSGAGAGGTPNYTVFNVGADGTLTQLTSATVGASAGSSPSQVLASPDGKTMFTNDFFGPLASPATGSLRSYKINADSSLTQNGSAIAPPTTVPANTAPPFVPFYSLVQGVQVHPTQRIVYASVPVTNQLAVYTYDASGVLSFNSFSPVSGAIPCWLVINKARTRMYIVETGSNSVSTFDITNPLTPKEVQYLPMGSSGPTFPLLPILPPLTSSAAAEESLDPNGNFLYVVSHHANPDPTFNGGGILHTLKVNSDGTLTEQGVGLDLGLSNAAHPQGMVTF